MFEVESQAKAQTEALKRENQIMEHQVRLKERNSSAHSPRAVGTLQREHKGLAKAVRWANYPNTRASSIGSNSSDDMVNVRSAAPSCDNDVDDQVRFHFYLRSIPHDSMVHLSGSYPNPPAGFLDRARQML